MHVYHPYESISQNSAYSLIIGAFDGIHRGHYSLWQQAYQYPDPIAVLTFDPPPKAYFAHQQAFQSLSDKYEIMTAWKTQVVYVLDFDMVVVNLSAQDFIHNILSVIPIQRIIVGQDFHFGAQQSGDITLLQQYYPCDTVIRSAPKVSSSHIRNDIAHYNYQLVRLTHLPHRRADAHSYNI